MRIKSVFFIVLFYLSIFSSKGILAERAPERDLSNEYFIILNKSPVPKSNLLALEMNKRLVGKTEKKIEKFGGKVLKTYLHAFVGFHAKLDPQQVSLLAKESNVKQIVKNGYAYLNEIPSSVKSWGLDRIDQVDLPLDITYSVPYAGEGTHSYVIDSGLRVQHEEFKGRVGLGFTALADNSSPYEDCNGHGTHVSGTVLGTKSGVAKKSIIHPVRVFGCSGGTGWDVVIKAIDWVAANHEKPAVINMSLGGGKNNAINLAVKNATKAGVHVVVSAGNSNADACKYSPAGAPEAITIAASDANDNRASFSNWGTCVDIFAPGVNIVSASHKGNTAYRSLNGTSMSSPHVAGAAALALGTAPGMTPAELEAFLIAKSNLDKITGVKGAPNRLLYVSEFGNAPKVSAGADQVIRLPQEEAILIGVAEDTDGFIVEASWKQVSGPEVTSRVEKSFTWKQHLILSNLVVGVYTFRFSATDNADLSSYDDVVLIVTDKNMAPIAVAGPDQKIKVAVKLNLDGSGSYDKDGSIATYLWKQKSGAAVTIKTPNAAKTEVTGQVPGTYEFTLTVTDNEGAQAEDQVKIIVNNPPVVNAGEDQSIDWPTNSTSLEAKASDSDGTIKSVLWKQVSGPSAATIANKNSLNTAISNLELGSYNFSITATDNMGDKVSDSVIVKVGATSKAPIVKAGEDVIIVLPENSVTLAGTCQDTDGICVKTSWRLVSFTYRSFISSLLEGETVGSKLDLSGLEQGVYTFRFTGEDDSMLKSSDEVIVTVKAAE